MVTVSSWPHGSVTLKAKAVAGGTSILQDRDSDFLQLVQWDFMGLLELGGKCVGKQAWSALDFLPSCNP